MCTQPPMFYSWFLYSGIQIIKNKLGLKIIPIVGCVYPEEWVLVDMVLCIYSEEWVLLVWCFSD